MPGQELLEKIIFFNDSSMLQALPIVDKAPLVQDFVPLLVQILNILWFIQ